MPAIRSGPARRTLQPGYDWQQYIVYALRPIDRPLLHSGYNNSMPALREGFHEWIGRVQTFINRRAEHLGLVVLMIAEQFVEEPNEGKIVEVAYWEERKAICVWSCWARLQGPVPAYLQRNYPLPLLNFWPRDLAWFKDAPEIFDARKLSAVEQGWLPTTVEEIR